MKIKRNKDEAVAQRDDGVLSLQREVNRLFDDFFTPFGRAWWHAPLTPAREAIARYTPAIDIKESDKEFTLTADLPGLEQKDVTVELDDSILTIKGERKSEHEQETDGRRYLERSHGTFSRSIELGPDIDTAKIKASMKNGVLTVALPKRAEARQARRLIEVAG